MQVEATAAEMEQPPKSVMLVTTAHILASHTAQEAAQRDSDGDDSRSGQCLISPPSHSAIESMQSRSELLSLILGTP